MVWNAYTILHPRCHRAIAHRHLDDLGGISVATRRRVAGMRCVDDRTQIETSSRRWVSTAGLACVSVRKYTIPTLAIALEAVRMILRSLGATTGAWRDAQ